MYEVPDMMGMPKRSNSEQEPLRDSMHNGGRKSRRSENIKRGGRTKQTLQRNGVEG